MGFFCDIYLLRILGSGVSNKFVLTFIFLFYNIIQTDNGYDDVSRIGVPASGNCSKVCSWVVIRFKVCLDALGLERTVEM